MQRQQVHLLDTRQPLVRHADVDIGLAQRSVHLATATAARAGWVDVLASAEFDTLRADPDLMMGGVRSLGESREPYPGWTALRAMQAGRVCRFAGAEADLVIRPGPRMAEAAMAMASCVREVYP